MLSISLAPPKAPPSRSLCRVKLPPMNSEELVASAFKGRKSAYAPYSGYEVGAAVLDEQDRVHVGCNVENSSFGATICAERAAVTRMVSEGGKVILAIAIATQDGGAPCGICLQVLSEFSPDAAQVEVICAATDGSHRTFKLSELLPVPFASDALSRTP